MTEENNNNLKEIKISEFKKELENLKGKYKIFISPYEYEERILDSLISIWEKEHNNFKVTIDSEIREMDNFKQIEKYLNLKFADSKNLRIEQLLFRVYIDNLNKDKTLKWFSYSEMIKQYPTETEFKTAFLKSTEKSITFETSLKDNYPKMEFVRKLEELIKIIYGIDKIFIGDAYNMPLKDVEKSINENQNLFKINLYLNGKVVLTFKDSEKQKILREIVLNRVLDTYSKIKKNN